MSLSHCIYTSRTTQSMDQAGLAAILHTARRANAALGVTGMLLHVEHTFFQILEGDDAVISRPVREDQ